MALSTPSPSFVVVSWLSSSTDCLYLWKHFYTPGPELPLYIAFMLGLLYSLPCAMLLMSSYVGMFITIYHVTRVDRMSDDCLTLYSRQWSHASDCIYESLVTYIFSVSRIYESLVTYIFSVSRDPIKYYFDEIKLQYAHRLGIILFEV